MLRWGRVWPLALVAIGMAADMAAVQNRRIALLIGNEEYSSEIGRLANPRCSFGPDGRVSLVPSHAPAVVSAHSQAQEGQCLGPDAQRYTGQDLVEVWLDA